jgi:hypothetical protein
MSRGEFWAFVGVACAVAFIVALLLTACQMPLRSAEYFPQLFLAALGLELPQRQLDAAFHNSSPGRGISVAILVANPV